MAPDTLSVCVYVCMLGSTDGNIDSSDNICRDLIHPTAHSSIRKKLTTKIIPLLWSPWVVMFEHGDSNHYGVSSEEKE